MIVFAIDPGNINSAYCVMNDSYELIEFAKLPNRECMDKMLSWLDKTDRVVIERIQSYGMAVGSEVFTTCEWIGRFSQEAEKKNELFYVYRKDEKLYICHDTRAKDKNIRSALIERFAKHDMKNGRGTKKNPDYFYGVSADVWAAISVAVTHLDMETERKFNERL